MKFKYLCLYSGIVWGKYELLKADFVRRIQRDELIINLEDQTYFDKDDNAWKPIEGDK